MRDRLLVRGLVEEGRNPREIARMTGVPRSTIRYWMSAKPRASELVAGCKACGQPEHEFHLLPKREYSYLLGVYLGDGYIARFARTYQLRVYSTYVGLP